MRRLLALLLCLTLLLCGCAAPNAKEIRNDLSFIDHSGNEVILVTRPQRVAVLFSSLAELWQTAGGEVAITVGESVERGFCPDTVLLVDQGAGKTVDTEALLAYAPDLVLGSADIAAHADAAALLKKAGIPCALLRVESFSDYLSVLEIFTDLTGNKEAYQKYGTDLQAEIGRILAAKRADAPRILFIRSGASARSAKAKRAEDHFAAAMLEELGCRNIADSAALLLDGLSVEEILRQDPAYIFISPMGDEAAAKAYMDSLLTQPAWQSLSAVKSGQVHYLPKEFFQYKPNARWAEAYQYLSEILNEE